MLMLFYLIFWILPTNFLQPFLLAKSGRWQQSIKYSIIFSIKYVKGKWKQKHKPFTKAHFRSSTIKSVRVVGLHGLYLKKKQRFTKKKPKTIHSTWHEHTFVCRVFVFVFVFMHVFRNLVKAKSNRIFDNASFGLFDFVLFTLQFNVLHFVSFFVLLISKCSSDPIRRRRRWRKRHRCVWLVRNWIQM